MPPDETIDSDIIRSLRSFAIENRLSSEQIKQVFSKEIASKIEIPKDSIPIEIFNRKLSALESIVKYLNENLDYGFTRIAVLTNRSSKTIWATCKNAQKKMPEKFSLPKISIYFPISILENRKFGVQEVIVKYLKEELSLSYHKIAILLNRNDRTVWTVYSRVREKSSTKDQGKQP
ncbi:hypothetical protein ACFL6I_22950 [candidate division KSB1 bacterium]